MARQRILFVVTLPPPVHGSAMVSQYIKDSKLINEHYKCDFVNLSTSRKMDEIGKKSPIKIWRFLSSYLILLYKLIVHRYALCYLAITCHGMGFLKDAPFVLLCKLFGRKIFIHQHNKGMNKDVDRPVFKHLLLLVYKNTKVILLSWRLYPDIEKVVKREQVLICPNGIPETFREDPHFNRNNKVPRLLFLSNLIESKGVIILLDACEILKDRGYSFVCNFVVGETKEIDAARFKEEVKRRGLNQVVVYHGRKYGKEKRNSFENADMFILPTYNETFGLVNLEAMEYKLPIVTTDEGGIPDVVKDGINGLICQQRNADDLADKIAYLIDHPQERVKMGEEGYKLYKKNFTYSCFENQLFNILKIGVEG